MEERMKELASRLNAAADAYYNHGKETMSNLEYDILYDELLQMERESKVVLPDSPTQKAGYKAVDSLPKALHEVPALSLDKTKDISAFREAFAKRPGMETGDAVVMWKMDGSTVIATYDDGKLTRLATRGNGAEGSDITHNAGHIEGLPRRIGYKGHLVVRGEAVMSYQEFERINEALPSGAEPYKNPRNLANASIMLLDSRELAQREIWFHAFKLVSAGAELKGMRMSSSFAWLKSLGFHVVEHELARTDVPETENGSIENVMAGFSARAGKYQFPVDGLVVASDDAGFADRQPGTGHNPDRLAGYALKWQDEAVETTLKRIEWSPSRTGLINPVAVFEPVELEGTTISRASLHNVSIVKGLRLRVGDRISVYKANKIIPQVAENLTKGEALSYEESHPLACPCCGSKADSMISGSDTEVAVCPNEKCPAKLIKKFVHFVERDCMNIEGMSEATIERLVDAGIIRQFADFFRLPFFQDEIAGMEGFGEKSCQNMVKAAERAKKTSFVPFLHALGIPNIGKGQAKLLDREFGGDVEAFFEAAAHGKGFQHIAGIGDVMEESIWKWAKENLAWWETRNSPDVMVRRRASSAGMSWEIYDLFQYLTFEKDTASAGSEGCLSGKIFVITGGLNHFPNRGALVSLIEASGGKAAGSVSSKTSFLINNDLSSTSGKNRKAKELGIPIISEEQFLAMTGQGHSGT